MRGANLGEFEELVLTMVAILEKDAHITSISIKINQVVKRKAHFAAVYASLLRLSKKGYVNSGFGDAGTYRGGRRKRIYRISGLGRKALQKIKYQRDKLWSLMPATMQIVP